VATALSPLALNPENPLRRDSPRPEHLRGPTYAERFDSLTVFYDCFRTADGRGTIMLGPPLFNLEPIVLRALQRAYGISWLSRIPSMFGPQLFNLENTFLHSLRRAGEISWFSRIPVRRFDRHSQIRLDSINGADLPRGLFQQDHLNIQQNCCELFRGHRVILTESRNNELQWIKDWVYFFVRKHGANAVLIYDNASTRYASDEIREAICSVAGVKVGVVVDWPYPFGVQDHEPYDSDYCQYGALEHARYRFLSHAEAVVNADIDEFPITARAEPLFDLVQRSSSGYLHYNGQWIENASLSADADGRRHRDYFHRLGTDPHGGTLLKWTIIPARCSPEKQWRVHDISRMTPDPLSSLVCYRHFRAINTSWLENRWHPEVPNDKHEVDYELKKWLQLFEAEPETPFDTLHR
jgi:hypothetical protein